MRKQRYLMLFVAGAMITISSLGLVSASSTTADISHAYHATSEVVVGSLVSLDAQKSNYVELANTNNQARVLGVAVAKNSSLLAFNPADNTVQIAISGTVSALVSTVNGNISVGDQITPSPFNGVGMKATPGAHVIGLAQSTLNPSTQNVTTEQVADKNGNKNQVLVSFVLVSLATGVNTAGNSNALGALQRLAQSITGHSVSNLRIALCVVVAVFALLSLMVLIYASIHGSIIAIGRNPLAKFSIFRTLWSTLVLAVLTAGLACLAIFVLLQ
jgi:hypothetical protein